MIPSQIAYLRKKNEELLNVLEKNARQLNIKVEICSELLRGRSHYCHEEFTDYQHKSSEMSPTTGLNRSVGVRLPATALNSAGSHRPVRSTSAIQIRSTSKERLHSPRRGHSTCIPSQPINHERSRDSRWSKLQQDLACHAHLHGYTLSHALSKCYCTRKEGSDTMSNITGSSRIVAESSSTKTRIPPRLKEKRYQANTSKQRTNSVKWAVPNEHKVPDRLPEDMDRMHLPIGGCDQENQNLLASLCGSDAQEDAFAKTRCGSAEEAKSEGDSDWFSKMRNFRKSNWDDCHAPERRNNDDICDCKCNRVYMIGERMFLEPVTSSVLNKECSCSKSREDSKPSRDVVVTLPKVQSEVREKIAKSKEVLTLSNRRAERSSGTYNINGPCFLTGHKTKHDDTQIRAFVQKRPPDSFALRYQKGVDPRNP